MRSRSKIERDADTRFPGGHRAVAAERLILEVLLDMRDLIANQPQAPSAETKDGGQ